jgi:hypothetical protein
MPRNPLPLAVLLLAASILPGCVQRHGDLSVVSSRNVDLDAEHEMVVRGAVGKAYKHIIIIIPTGMPNMEEAIDAALDEHEGDYLTNAKISYLFWFIPYIYGQFGYKVEGDVWKKVEEPANE